MKITFGPYDARVVVYLDTSDWSYLADGKELEAEQELRAFGATTTRFILSFDHLLEFRGQNQNSLAARLEFIRTFPGTIFIGTAGEALLEYAAREFIGQHQAKELERVSIESLRFADISLRDLLERMSALEVVRRVQEHHSRLVAKHAHLQPNKTQFAERKKVEKVAREEGERGLKQHLERRGLQLGGKKRIVQAIGAFLLPRFQRFGVEHGLLTSVVDPDPHFADLVGRYLSKDERRNAELLMNLHRSWRAGDLPYALHCASRIRQTQPPVADVQKVRSTAYDLRHAMFAGSVDVFTCDKRTFASLQSSRWNNDALLRTGRLRDVVAAIRRVSASHADVDQR